MGRFDELFGFPVVVIRDKDVIFVNHVERGETYAISLTRDFTTQAPTLTDVADKIADLLVRDTTAELAVYEVVTNGKIPDEMCPFCGI